MSTSTEVAVPALGNTPSAPSLPADKRADEFSDYPRDQWGRPLIILLSPDGSPMRDPATGEFVRAPYQRASGAGSAIEFEGGIQSWKLRQTIIGLIARPDLWALAQSVIEPQGAGRTEMDKTVVKPAQEAAGSDLAANLGTAGHAFAEKVDRGIELPPLSGSFAAWVQTYRTLTTGWRWSLTEARLVWDAQQLAGRVDRIGSPPGFMIAPDGAIIGPDDLVVVDIKTSSSSRYFGAKFAVQLAVYACGRLYDLETGQRTPTGARTDWGLVVHIPTGGTSGALYWVNLAVGAELAALAKQVMRERGRKDLVSAVDSTRVYATLDEALAAGGRLDPASQEYAAVIIVDEVRQQENLQPLSGAASYSPIDAAAGGSGFSTVPQSVTAAIPPDLGPQLQRGAAERQLARELAVIAQAGVTSPLADVRTTYAASWTDQHQGAYDLREWELGIIAALQGSSTVDNLTAVANMCVGWGRWTPEMRIVARRRQAEITNGGES